MRLAFNECNGSNIDVKQSTRHTAMQHTRPKSADKHRSMQQSYNIDIYRPPLILFPFLPPTTPSSFLPSASRTLFCPAHATLIVFIRTPAIIANPTALSDNRLRSCLPIFPLKLSARRTRGEEWPVDAIPISERRFRSMELLEGIG